MFLFVFFLRKLHAIICVLHTDVLAYYIIVLPRNKEHHRFKEEQEANDDDRTSREYLYRPNITGHAYDGDDSYTVAVLYY